MPNENDKLPKLAGAKQIPKLIKPAEYVRLYAQARGDDDAGKITRGSVKTVIENAVASQMLLDHFLIAMEHKSGKRLKELEALIRELRKRDWEDLGEDDQVTELPLLD